mmetsp:Transcript_34829/g.76223  ORF Transcript_34829/g.76223 Transcript_34829/m.76223 type:complete len:93 (+) Transcript_34829:1602-1880(+)
MMIILASPFQLEYWFHREKSHHRRLSKQIDALFFYLVKDRALRDFYPAGMHELGMSAVEDHYGACCADCAAGTTCSRSLSPYPCYHKLDNLN